MKRNKKTLLTLALATMFVGAGAGAIAAIDTVSEPAAITASAENPAIDMASSVSVLNWGAVGDFADTPLYRIALTAGDANAWEFGNFLMKNSETAVLEWIYVNGKSVAQHVAEYKAAVEAGEREHVTSLCNELGNDPVNYAPIFVKILHHPSLSAKCLDIYIPTDYLPANEVTSIVIKKDFSTEALEEVAGKVTSEQEYYLSKDVELKIKPNNSFTGNLFGAVVADLEEVPVNVTGVKWYGTGESRNWFGLTLDGHNFPESGNNEADKDYADALKLYDNIYVDGVSLASYCVTDASPTTECYFTGSGHHGVDVLSFRTPSQFNATKIAAAQEIVIKAGCQLPMYDSTTKCFVVENDIVFKNINGTFVNADELIEEVTNVHSALTQAPIKDAEGNVAEYRDVITISFTLPNGLEFPHVGNYINEWDYNYGGEYAVARSLISIDVGGEYMTIDEISAIGQELNAELYADTEGKTPMWPFDVFEGRAILLHIVDAEKTGGVRNTMELYIDAALIPHFEMETLTVKIGAGFTVGIASNQDVGVVATVSEDILLENVPVVAGTVTVDGEEKKVMLGSTLEQPTAEASYEEGGYLYTLEGWKDVNGDLWNFDEDVAYEGLVLTKSYEKEAIEYTISFNHPRTGMPLAAPINFTVETMDEVVFPAVPAEAEREGYTVAWDKTVADVTLADLQVVPVWTAIKYTATFVADGQTVGTVEYTVEDEEIAAPAVPEKAHYTGAWEAYELAIGGVTVEAVYTPVEYTVTFVADGETVGTDTYTVEDKEITVPGVPAKDHYTGAWGAYELNGGNVTVNAVYTAVEYTISFNDPRTGMPLAAPITFTIETKDSVEFPAVPEDLAMPGYTVAWDKTAADVTLADLQVAPVLTIIEYTVTFVADGETVDTATYTVENTEITVPEAPAKEYYTVAWESYTLTTGDVTVNAVYTAVEYTVTFVADGETVGTVTYTVDSTEITAPEVPAKSGYTAAWEAYELNGGDVTVNAVYTEIPAEPAEEEGGCGSVIGGVSAAVAMLGAAVVVLKKKKED
ncbi:MAG: InlB B-repeat-containing protein [Clostridia bacterium]|nr:InlB B-repeat-containing protein [Clostridia bacterium]